MPTFDLYLFDLDGTLVDTAPEVCDAVNDTLRRFDLPEVGQVQVTEWIGHGMQELLIQAVAHAGQIAVATVRGSDSLALIASEFSRYYLQRCGSRSQLYPHVREVLLALRARNAKLALVTNKESRYAAALLTAHALTPLFDLQICGDTLPSRKPDPAGIEHCLSATQVPRERALFVGDSSIDVAAARQAGVAVWAVPYGYNMGQAIAESRPDRILSDLAELLDE